MGKFRKLVKEYRSVHGVGLAEARRKVRAQAARSGPLLVPPQPPSVYLPSRPPPSGPTNRLGEFRFDGHWVKQRVLTDGRIEISYSLAPNGGYLGPLIGVMGFGEIPDWVRQEAAEYAQRHKARLLAMLRATRHGAFKADRAGISARFNTAETEISVWFTRWTDERPIVRSAPGLDHDTAQQLALHHFLEVPTAVRKRLHAIARPHDKLFDREKAFVLECLRWPATYFDQTVQQLWSFAERAGLTETSAEEIAVAAQLLFFEGKITQKSGDSSDCFWVTEEQLRALGGAAEPAWAAVHVREMHPGSNRKPDHALPASPDTPCTLAPEGTDVRDAMTLDHLTPRGDGKLYAFDDDDQPWPGAIVTLADCRIGDLVYLNRSNWVASPAYWTLYEIVAPDGD